MAEDVRSSILQMAKGAIQERVDYEVSRVIDNILDMNTEPTVKRKVVLTIELKPDEGRQVITMSASAKSTLAPHRGCRGSGAVQGLQAPLRWHGRLLLSFTQRACEDMCEQFLFLRRKEGKWNIGSLRPSTD